MRRSARWGRGLRRVLGALTGLALILTAAAEPPYVSESHRFTAPVPEVYSDFGGSVAIDGDTVVIGEQEAGPTDDGAAYVFERSGGVWDAGTALIPSVLEEGDLFGDVVDVDGDTAVVTARLWDGGSYVEGAVHVFVRDPGGWTEQARLEASDADYGRGFGAALALDGDTLLIGARSNEPAGHEAGSAYVFTRAGGVWTEVAKLTPSDPAETQRFGLAVALSGDTAVVGAALDDELGESAGAAYVFTRAGGVWSQTAKLLAADGVEGDRFGYDVAVDGDLAVVSAIPAAGYFTRSGGGVYTFTRTGGVWSAGVRSEAAALYTDRYFGAQIALDADTLVVAAPYESVRFPGEGVLHVFRRVGDAWFGTLRLIAADALGGSRLGQSVALSGSTAIGGAPDGRFEENGYLQIGYAFAFDGVDVDLPPPRDAANGFLSPTRVRLVGTTLTVQATLDLGDKTVDFADPVEIACGPRSIELPGGLVPNRRLSCWTYTSADRNTRVTVAPPNDRRGDSKGRICIVIRDWTEPLPSHPGGAGELLEVALTCGLFDVDCAVRLDGGTHVANVQTAAAPSLVLDRVSARLSGPNTPSIAVTASFAGDALLPPGPPAVALRMGEPGDLYEVLLPTPDHVVTSTPGGWSYIVPDPDGVGPLLPQGAWRVDVDYVHRQVQAWVRGEDLGSFTPRSAPFYFALSLGGDEHAVQVCVGVRNRTMLSYR